MTYLKKKWYETKRVRRPPPEERKHWVVMKWKRVDFGLDGNAHAYEEYQVVHKNNIHNKTMWGNFDIVATDLTLAEAKALIKLY